jgi:hypothetical protein
MSRRLHPAANLGPLLGGRVAQRVGAVERFVGAADGLAVRLDERRRIKLGVSHHDVQRGVAEQRLDDVRRGVVVEVLGGEDRVRMCSALITDGCWAPWSR